MTIKKRGIVVVYTVPFLYQTSPRPFNEEVDFFDFLGGYRVQVKNEKMDLHTADGDRRYWHQLQWWR